MSMQWPPSPPPDDPPGTASGLPPTGAAASSSRHLQRPRLSRRVIGGLVLLVALLTAVTALLARPHSDTPGPGEIAVRYETADDLHDYPTRWSLMTPRAQAYWGSEAAFAAYEVKLQRDIQGHCCHFSQVLAHQTTVTGNQAVVEVARLRKTDGSDNPDTVYLRQLGGRWLVDAAGEKPPPGWDLP